MSFIPILSKYSEQCPLSINYVLVIYIYIYIHCSIGTVCRRISLISILLVLFHRDRQFSCSSCVNCPSWISIQLSIIFVISSSVILGDFPNKSLKCSINNCIRSSWLAAFSFTLLVLFLLLTSFTVCQAIGDFLSSTEKDDFGIAKN